MRAIRSYVGANSGPYTQRTNVFYATHQEIVTDLRVHPIASLFTHCDLSPAAAAMTYSNSANPEGTPVDGVDDPVSDAVAGWHLWTGAQGTLFATDRVQSSFADRIATGSVTGFYEDRVAPSFQQCWGDSSLYGAAGVFIAPSGGVPNTDPAAANASEVQTLRSTSTLKIAAPGATRSEAEAWSAQANAPLSAIAERWKRRR